LVNKANRCRTSISKSLALLPFTLQAGVKKAETSRRDVNEKDVSDHSNSVVVGGLGRGANLAKFIIAINVRFKFAIYISIVNLTQPVFTQPIIEP
jgi:hypothetical protein